MLMSCPGCMARLKVDDEAYEEKVLVQCPECLFVFLARPRDESAPSEASNTGVEPSLEPGEATMLTSDNSQKLDPREFQWNVPGASLTVIEGDNQGVHRKITHERMVIGRKGADLAIDDKAISRAHCEIFKRDGEWLIRDLDSTNGTFLNGVKIGEEKLHHLDEIRIGQTIILFAESHAPDGKSFGDRAMEETKADPGSDRALPLPQDRIFHLEFMAGPQKGRSLRLAKSRSILGRGEEADVGIDDNGVSRKHAVIDVYSREQVYITDLASRNGTWLNGMKISTTRLLHGDLVRIGNIVIKFVVQDTV